ncbi:MAG: hypothetical protein V8T51_06030 [Senegalimassilia faecalis]
MEKKIILKDGEKEIEVVKTEDLKLLGKHNFAEMLWPQLQWLTTMEYPWTASLRASAVSEPSVQHNLYVTEKKGVVYYNTWRN